MTRDEILMAVARGWCTPENKHKEMDSVLVSAIVSEIMQAQTNAQQPHGEICSNNICDYCNRSGKSLDKCGSCTFVGRKLSPC